ncbi:hypothetical protein [Variovorax ginsengisoli]|uniref:Uncharacterized protein n=1 Tax=Variovorax ginsengisoli TaxID=363844 RepID=A0ABT9S9K1_9BURK|nr:hypothetical protein [Variovorax ginsengisoli]MDP9901034.1 hypothetical protein [Variovorax ginsengisoli]
MLQLNSEQVAALQALKRQRDMARVSDTLAAAFPDIPGRLGERYAALIAHGATRAATHGLAHTVCLGRYLACWFVLGASFETRPEFAWAADLLAATDRSQGSKVFQLCRRAREELARLSAQTTGGAAGAAGTIGVTSPAAFDLALALLDRALMPRGVLGDLLPPERIALGDACDIDAIDLRLLDAPAARQPHRYRLEQGQWRLLPVVARPAAITLSAGLPVVARQPRLTLPPMLHLLSQPPGREGSRLRLRTRSRNCCDAQVHPLVTLNGPLTLGSWRGPHAGDVALDLYAEAAAPAVDDGPQPRIAIETSPQLSELHVSSCGLRDSGQALGELQTRLAVYPAEQHWMLWKREPAAAMAWPDTGATTPASAPAVYRIERDGLALDTSRWSAGLEDLDRQLGEGLTQLATAWERESGVSQGRVMAEPSVMAGSAGLTWGWAGHGADLSDPPWYRVAGELDLVACELRLRLGGSLALHGSLSRLVLHCSGRASLQARFERQAEDADLPALLAPAATQFRHPFVLQLESLAQADSAALAGLAGPVSGALVGACGLRARKAGPGLQWFCQLSIEPVCATLMVHDPLLGTQRVMRPLLPALQLLDWSLG